MMGIPFRSALILGIIELNAEASFDNLAHFQEFRIIEVIEPVDIDPVFGIGYLFEDLQEVKHGVYRGGIDVFEPEVHLGDGIWIFYIVCDPVTDRFKMFFRIG